MARNAVFQCSIHLLAETVERASDCLRRGSQRLA